MDKKKYSNDDRYEIKRQLIETIRAKIILCDSCNEGYIADKQGNMTYCECCAEEMIELKRYSDVEVSVPTTKEYEAYLQNRRGIFYNTLQDKICIECGNHFKTTMKGRARCEVCFKEYTSQFRQVGAFLKEEDQKNYKGYNKNLEKLLD